MNATFKTIFITAAISIAIGFGACYFTIVLPAAGRAATALTKSNDLAEQYKKQAAAGAITISDMSTTIAGQKSDIATLRSQNQRANADNKRLDDTNKQLERDKGQLTSQLGFFSDYYNKSQQQDKQFGLAVDAAQGAVGDALADIRQLQSGK